MRNSVTSTLPGISFPDYAGCVCEWVHMYMCVCVCTHACVCTCMCVCVSVLLKKTVLMYVTFADSS